MFGRILGVIIAGVGLYIGWFGVQVMLSGVLPAFIIVFVGVVLLSYGLLLIGGESVKETIRDLFIRMP